MRCGSLAPLALAACLIGSAHAAEDARLIDQTGRPVAQSELSRHWLLVYFGYSACPDACPAALTTITQVMAALGAAGDVVWPLFVSLDPAHDTPAVLRAYAAHFTPRLRALTGSASAVADAARSFGVPWQARGGGAGFDHGEFIYLVAPGGEVVELIHPGTGAADIARRIRARHAEVPRR